MNTHTKSLALTISFLCLAVVRPLTAAEPNYNGKPLSEWLFYLMPLEHNPYNPQPGEPTPEEAVRQIGTNGIPTLLDILGATHKNEGWVLGRMKSKAFRECFRNKNVPLDDLQDIAVKGFGILGTNAVSAIPQINKLFHNRETCYAAAAALMELGPEGFAALTNGMSDKGLAGVVVWTIGERGGGDIQTVTRLLITALKSPDGITRGNAARSLAGKDPTLAVPALIPLLDEKSFYPREGAVLALGSYGPAARSAAPKLFSVYTNVMLGTNLGYAHALGVFLLPALQGVDPDTAAKAEAFIINNGPLGVAGSGWTTTKLPNGKELIAGGFFKTTILIKTNYVFSRAELFDPTTGKRMETSSMSVARSGHTATLLRNGKVLVAGGNNLGVDGRLNRLSSAELYDPATGKWTETGSMNAPHAGGEAVLQHDGKVLIGNWRELYDPATGTWTVVTNK
jgi:hypothetical protein